MELLILALSMLISFVTGSYITYRAYKHQNPVLFLPENDDIPAPISPYEEEMKKRKVYVDD